MVSRRDRRGKREADGSAFRNRERGAGCVQITVDVPASELLRRIRLPLALGGTEVHDEGVAPFLGGRVDAVLVGTWSVLPSSVPVSRRAPGPRH